MIIDTGDGRLYLITEHAEMRLVERKILEEWIIDTLLNLDIEEPSKDEGRLDRLKNFPGFTLKIVTEPDPDQYFDEIIVTIIRKNK